MNKSTIEAGQPEQVLNNEPEADIIPSAQVPANALVGGSFSSGNNLENENVLSLEILNAIDLIIKDYLAAQ